MQAWPPGPSTVPPTCVHQDRDRKSTRLNSSHLVISYAVFCLKKNTHKKVLDDPNFSKSLSHLQSTLARLDHMTGCCETDLNRTLDYLSPITDKLRDLTEDGKH